MQFSAIVEPPEPMRGLEIPLGVMDALGGGARPRVVVTVNGHSWSTRVAVLRGRNLIGVSHANRSAAGAEVGEQVTVDLVLDEEPMTVVEPADVAAALDGDPGARAAFDRRTVSQRRQHIRVIEQAKGADTRARRVAALVDEMRARS